MAQESVTRFTSTFPAGRTDTFDTAPPRPC